jgi:hypothetical protein
MEGLNVGHGIHHYMMQVLKIVSFAHLLSESELLYCQSVHLCGKPLETHDQHFFFQLNTCGHSPYVISCLTRGWVYHLQFLLTLTSTVILRSESRWTHDHVLLSQIQDSPNLEGPGPHIYIAQEQGGPVIPPGTGFPFCHPLWLAGLRWRYSSPTLPPHRLTFLDKLFWFKYCSMYSCCSAATAR